MDHEQVASRLRMGIFESDLPTDLRQKGKLSQYEHLRQSGLQVHVTMARRKDGRLEVLYYLPDPKTIDLGNLK